MYASFLSGVCVCVPMCVCVVSWQHTCVCVSCGNWPGQGMEEWMPKMWKRFWKVHRPWATRSTEAKETRLRISMRKQAVSGNLLLLPGSLWERTGRKKAPGGSQWGCKASKKQNGLDSQAQKLGWHSLLDTQVQGVFCPSEVQELSFHDLTRRMNIPCLLCHVSESDGHWLSISSCYLWCQFVASLFILFPGCLGIRTMQSMVYAKYASPSPTELCWQGKLGCVHICRLDEKRTTFKGPWYGKWADFHASGTSESWPLMGSCP